MTTQTRPIDVDEVLVQSEDVRLEGTLTLPRGAAGIVLFAHGSGSGRFSSRNRFVADILHDAGLATLLFDLLTPRENQADEVTREFRFNIDLLTSRLSGATDWVRRDEPRTQEMRVGLFGASTGAAAALRTASERSAIVNAVVSRGGRPDLAGEALPIVRAPSLFIVGSADEEVLTLNREAASRMDPPPKIEVIPGASHLFEEPGTLEKAARAAKDFFVRYLSA